MSSGVLSLQAPSLDEHGAWQQLTQLRHRLWGGPLSSQMPLHLSEAEWLTLRRSARPWHPRQANATLPRAKSDEATRQRQHAIEQLTHAAWMTALPSLSAPLQRLWSETVGALLMENRRYQQAAQHFQRFTSLYLAGYNWVLFGRLEEARRAWVMLHQQNEQTVRSSPPDSSSSDVAPIEPKNHWGVYLFGMITRQLHVAPSFIQVRNHLEMDIAYLIEARQEAFLANLLTYLDFLSQMNPETPKMAGRMLMHHGRLVQAKPLLYQAQANFPTDAEIYYHLGQYYCHCKLWHQARLALRQCLRMTSHYWPAQFLLDQLEDTSYEKASSID
jgi:tetratricopeptide (TPR) repeat protein